ncbi:YHYH protein [Thalassospira marina]|uniref:YHYH domain-containing protein n=1 Tax=Thalassospira marina TaxID=2048283 RepID=A0ABM6Q582_9PROT|nr:YHYH protein [Thalassospira marina]AUG51671.1 hypothetical protein CSC3H3_02305 [Thalassospira marina]
MGKTHHHGHSGNDHDHHDHDRHDHDHHQHHLHHGDPAHGSTVHICDEGAYQGDHRPEIDHMRRNVLVGLGMLPLAAMVLNPVRQAWALANQVTIREDGEYRYIRSNAIPDHAVGQFPNRHNPNTIKAQSLEFRLPVNPVRSGRFTPNPRNMFGIAVNGVPFDPYTAEFWQRDRQSGWRYEAISPALDLGLDENNAHVQPDGTYHYHGVPKGLIKSWSPSQHSIRIGFAADGFPVYALYGYIDPHQPASGVKALTSSWRVKKGARPGGPGGNYDGTFGEDYEFVAGLGDLDEANGRETITPEYPGGTYAYFVTESFPFIPRFLAGTADASFDRGPPPGGMDRPRPGGGFGGPGGMGGPGGAGGFPGDRPPPPLQFWRNGGRGPGG